MNEKQFYIEFYTARKGTNRGSKTCVKPFSAKLLSAFENEKITVYAEQLILQVLYRGIEVISLNSVNVTWNLQILASAVETFGWRDFWNHR